MLSFFSSVSISVFVLLSSVPISSGLPVVSLSVSPVPLSVVSLSGSPVPLSSFFPSSEGFSVLLSSAASFSSIVFPDMLLPDTEFPETEFTADFVESPDFPIIHGIFSVLIIWYPGLRADTQEKELKT